MPAYKGKYLSEALQSLANQIDNRFNVYVSDDCSPEDLEPVAAKFSDVLNLRYVRFENNLGKDDLVAHWERSLALIAGEEFVCMFSDDDIMSPDCISSFYSSVDAGGCDGYDVFHFNMRVIDASGNLLSSPPEYAPLLASSDFFRLLYSGRIDARMPEFVFRSSVLKEKGFVKFDLAFRTDNATVMSLASERGIKTIPGGTVFWRDSGYNVSKSIATDSVRRMVMASIDFFNWTETFFANERYPLDFKHRIKMCVNEIARLYPSCARKEISGLLHKIKFISRSRFNTSVAEYFMDKRIRKWNRHNTSSVSGQ